MDAGGFLRNPWKERKPPSWFSGSGAAQMDPQPVGSRTAVSCPTPDPGEALHLKCELGVRPGEWSAPHTEAPMHRGPGRGSSAWGSEVDQKQGHPDSTGRFEQTQRSDISFSHNWLGLQCLSEEGLNLMP